MKIKKRIIEIEVNDEFITGSGVVIGAAGSHNDVVIRARFNENWVGLNIVAIFKDANGENPTAIPVVMSSVSTLKESDPEYEVHEFTVPFGVKKYEGRVSLAFLGYNVAAVVEDEELAYTEEAVMSSGTSYFNVLQSDVIMADDLYPDANPGQQLHKDVDTLGEMYEYLDKALAAITEIQGKLGSATITIADLGTLEENIKKTEGGIEELKDFLEYTHPDEQGEANMFDRIYPIGSIYMSVKDTDPAQLFGGSWVRLKDRFLLGAGDTYGAGTEGGSADAVIVSHSHTITKLAAGNGGIASGGSTLQKGWGGEAASNIANETNYILSTVGTDGKGKNMPPYLAVYMWKREA